MCKTYKGMGVVWLLVLIGALLFSTTLYGMEVFAAEEGVEESVEADLSSDFTDEDMVIIEEEESEDEAIGFREDKVFLDFKEADIRDVLRVFARKAQINIVSSQRVQGTVTVKLTDVHWEKALQLILEQNNFVLQKDDDGIYKVFTQDEVGAVPLQTKVYSLSYIKADEARKILTPLLTPERGKIEADTSGNKLIVSDVPGKLNDVEDVLSKLDSRIRQVSIEVRILERTSGEESDFGIKWDALKAYKVSATNIRDSFERIQIDQERYTEWKRTDTDQIISPITTPLSSDQSTTRIFGDIEMQDPNKNYKTAKIRTAILSVDDFSLTLSALLSDSNTELISHPKIATVDNRPAKIKVTRRIPIPQYSYNDTTGTYEIKSFSFEDIGIILEVTPQINQDEYITLEVKPSVTTQFGEKTFVISGGSIDIPIIDERSAETKVIVKSRETLVIGGLVSTAESKIIKKVPLLGDLPLVKYLFRHKSTIKMKKDLVFFITPTLIEGDIADVGETQDAENEPVEIIDTVETPESE